MNTIEKTIDKLSQPDKGILAIDESPVSIGKRFDRVGVKNTEEKRREYRDLLITTPKLGDYLSGIILHKETYFQKTDEGISFLDILKQQNIAIGVKMDTGKIETNNEFVTTGIEDLEIRLSEFSEIEFAKWRAVFKITDSTPSEENVKENADLLAQYARICIKNNVVPIVEPEILREGSHGIDMAKQITEKVLSQLMESLASKGVPMNSIVLKPAMITGGSTNSESYTKVDVAEATIRLFDQMLPIGLNKIAFLSGGIDTDYAFEYLNEIRKINSTEGRLYTFSFGRALHQPVLELWSGESVNKAAAQKLLIKNLLKIE